MGRWRPPARQSAPYITAAGYRALEAEAKDLWARRREVAKHLAAAAAEGDRSENAEYIYRKKALRELDRRILYLQRRMPNLRVVTEAPAEPDRVFFGAMVELEDAHGDILKLRVVGGDEADANRGDISVDTPLARVLLGRALDDEFDFRHEDVVQHYIVLSIDYVLE